MLDESESDPESYFTQVDLDQTYELDQSNDISFEFFAGDAQKSELFGFKVQELMIVRNKQKYEILYTPTGEVIASWEWEGINTVKKPILATQYNHDLKLLRVITY